MILHNDVIDLVPTGTKRCAVVTVCADGVDELKEAGKIVSSGEPFWLSDSVPDPLPPLWEDMGEPSGVGD